MEHSTDVLFDSTIIIGAHFAEGEQLEACRAVLALAEQRRIRAHICGNALGQIAEDLARSEGKDSAKEWITEARQYLHVVATSSQILDAALSHSSSADGVLIRRRDHHATAPCWIGAHRHPERRRLFRRTNTGRPAATVARTGVSTDRRRLTHRTGGRDASPPDPASFPKAAELAGNIFFCQLFAGVFEHLFGIAHLDQISGPAACEISTEKNAVVSATRVACCMLWVTRATV